MFGPFLFLFPLLLTVLAVRAGMSLFYSVQQRPDRSPYLDGEPLYRGHHDPALYHPAVLQSRVFKLAYRLGGRVTVSDVVIETGLSVDESEELLQSLVDNARVRMEVDDRGMMSYEFPEIQARAEHERRHRFSRQLGEQPRNDHAIDTDGRQSNRDTPGETE